MANRLQFKRGNGAPGAILRAGEPAFDTTNNILYVGLNTAGTDNNAGQIIGGASYVERVDSIIVSNEDINVGGVATINNLNVTGIATIAGLDFGGSGSLEGLTSLSVDDLSVSGIVTANGGEFQTLEVALTSQLTGDVTLGAGIGFDDGSGVLITEFSTDTELGGPGGSSDSVIPTQRAVRGAIDAVVLGQVGALTLEIGSDSGDGVVGLGSTSSDVLTIEGGNSIETEIVGAGSTIQVSLSDDVTVNNDLTVGGKVEVTEEVVITGGIQVGGAVTFSGDFEYTGDNLNVTNDLNVGGIATVGQDLIVERNLSVAGLTTLTGEVVVNGNLTVAGTATEVKFEVRDVQVEDRIIELGRVGGEAPTVDTTWETGLALNYRTGGTAKKAGILWQDNAGFNLLADFNETVDATQSSDPQVGNDVGGGDTYTLAKAGVAELFIGDVTTAANKVVNSDKDASFAKLYVGDSGSFAGTDIGGGTFKAFAEKEADGLVHIYNANFDGGTY